MERAPCGTGAERKTESAKERKTELKRGKSGERERESVYLFIGAQGNGDGTTEKDGRRPWGIVLHDMCTRTYGMYT